MNYCTKHNELCEYANAFGYCSVTACTKYNLTTEPKRDDGIYMQLFCVKNGVRYDMKVVDLKEFSTTLTDSLMDGIEKLCN